MIAFEQRASTVLFNLLRGLPRHGPVLLPDNVCPVVPLVLLKLGRSFELVDISPDNLCIDRDAVLERWTDRSSEPPAALVYVRTYGLLEDQSAFFSQLRALQPEALLVDDRCLCRPSFELPGDNEADVLLYSTGYGKPVDIGFGGYGLMRPGVRYERASIAFNATHLDAVVQAYKGALASGRQYEYVDFDWLDGSEPVQAWDVYRSAVETERIASDRHRESINAVYAERLPEAVQLPHQFQTWRFNLNVRNKSQVLQAIAASGLFASGHYESLGRMFGRRSGPVSLALHAHVVNLFNDRHFDTDRARALVDVLFRLDPPLSQGCGLPDRCQ